MVFQPKGTTLEIRLFFWRGSFLVWLFEEVRQ